MQQRRLLRPVALLAILFAGGQFLRGSLPIDGFSAEAIRDWVTGLGWRGPVIYLSLVTFRQFLFLPAALLLPAGGLCFGVSGGTLLGCTGIMLSGSLKFMIARTMRRHWGDTPMSTQLHGVIRRLQHTGPLLVGLGTAHPIGPMTPLHWAAGFAGLPFGGFLAAIAIGGLVRAGLLAVVGSTALATDSATFYAACAVLTVAILSPLLHSGLRQRLLARPLE